MPYSAGHCGALPGPAYTKTSPSRLKEIEIWFNVLIGYALKGATSQDDQHGRSPDRVVCIFVHITAGFQEGLVRGTVFEEIFVKFQGEHLGLIVDNGPAETKDGRHSLAGQLKHEIIL